MTHLVTPNRGEAQPGSWLGRALLGFIDNDGAKHVLAKGGSSSLEASAVCDGVSAREIAGAVLTYWERVPTASNIADAPSRGVEPARLPGWPSPSRVLVAEGARSWQMTDVASGNEQSQWVSSVSRLFRGLRDSQVG